jgi:adenylyltransferase/sulfurtransferase
MINRYSSQIVFPEIGKEGQRKIEKAKVTVIGCGALGCIISNNLVRAGIGKIKIVDRDLVEMTNLQRQILYDEEDVKNKIPKSIAAKRKLEKINSEVEIEAIVSDVNFKNIEELIKNCDIVLDGTDNFETRFLINDACLKYGIPWIYGAVIGAAGSTMTIIPEKTPCLRCIIEEIPLPGTLPTCDTLGVLNTIPNVIASLQTTETLKIIVGEKNLNEDLITIDLWTNSFEKMKIERKKDCPSCVKRNYLALEGEEISYATTLCGRNAVQIVPRKKVHISFEKLEEKLKLLGKVKYNEFVLSFEIQDYEFIVFPNARTIIKGTTDISIAKTLYAKYLGI